MANTGIFGGALNGGLSGIGEYNEQMRRQQAAEQMRGYANALEPWNDPRQMMNSLFMNRPVSMSEHMNELARQVERSAKQAEKDQDEQLLLLTIK